MGGVVVGGGGGFFFFQAEDGIRDDLVTGVQTCALPISNFHQTEWLLIRGGGYHAELYRRSQLLLKRYVLCLSLV